MIARRIQQSLRIASALLLLGVMLSRCSPAKKLPDGKYLLVKNVIRVDDDRVAKDDLHSILKQKPNKKILGLFRFHLAAYQMAGKNEKEKGLRKALRKTIGEEPVVLDSFQLGKSVRQLEIYMQNKGYFRAVVKDSVATYPKSKKARIFFTITSGEPYTLRHVKFAIEDTVLHDIVKRESAVQTVLHPGDIYNVDKLHAERKWITTELRNRGYYFFSRDYIYFKVDTTVGNHSVDLELGIKNPGGMQTDTANVRRHMPYQIGHIYVYTKHKPLQPEVNERDTIAFEDVEFIQKGPMEFRPEALTKVLFISKDDLFQEKGVDYTYRRLSALKQFKFINLDFSLPKDSGQKQVLDAHIFLTPIALQSITLETEGTHSGGNLGIAGNLVYRHRNIFKGAEILEVKLKGALEAQRSLTLENDTINPDKSPFNTLEFGPEISIHVPDLLIPFLSRGVSRTYEPRTILKVGYFFQQRADFLRKIGNISFTYRWKETQFKNHSLTPVDLNFVKVELDPAARQILEERKNIFLLNSYSDHMTLGTSYSFVFNNQSGRKGRDFSFFRADGEVAGNLLRAISSMGSAVDTGSGYTFFGVRYAQYARTHLDYRHYFAIGKNRQLVARISGGLGLAYGNLPVMPLEKSFFGGGANGIRAWRVRSLGPGAYQGQSTFDQIGDVKFESNLEYRFNIISYMKGAVFVDAGNIWLVRKEEGRPGGEISSAFYKQMAVGSGIGARFDFTFFIIRLDMGLKMLDPSFPEGERLVVGHMFDKAWKADFKQTYNSKYSFMNLNLGIGYPF
ncbi:MAG: BamA/TamA family outer membrane protein [Flavobacteriales bacterium]|nr:BamA/TamA family outer membrane protein [Flavobacteriales bacterium]